MKKKEVKLDGFRKGQVPYDIYVKKAGIELNRKSLSELAINDKAAFAAIASEAKKALEK